MKMLIMKILWVRVWSILLFFGFSSPAYSMSPILLGKGNDFCKRKEHSLECTFKSTDQPVILEQMEAGIQGVKIESAKTFRGLSFCDTNIVIWTSSNVTLLGYNAKEEVGSFLPVAIVANASHSEPHTRETLNQGLPILFPTGGEPASTAGHYPSRAAKDNGSGGQPCPRNVSINQSNVRLLQGGFNAVSIQSSKVESVDGLFRFLLIKQRCEVMKFSASVNSLVIQETQMAEVSEMKVDHSFQVKQTTIKFVGKPGIVLSQSMDNSSVASPSSHEMRDLSVGSLKEGKIVVRGTHLVMDSVTIDEIGAGGISIEAGGSATLNNVKIGRGPDFCIVLRGSASISVRNFSIRGKTIDHLDISVANVEWAIYPLEVLPNQKPGVRISQRVNTSSGSEEESKGFVNLDWYWVPVMAAVGLVSGMVIACAVRCSRRQRRPNEMLSSLSFSELVARERHCNSGGELEDCANGHVGPHHPDLMRQDSGLTSSSFASYTACVERRLSCERRASACRHAEDIERTSNSNPDSSVFIHVPPIACTRESVIYEEVETLQPHARENTYVTMK